MFRFAAVLVLDLLYEEQTAVSPAARDEHGYQVHKVSSPYQSEATLIRVLTPDDDNDGVSYSVVYVLPVEPNIESRYGVGLDEIKKLDLQNKHRAIFVAPTFADLPWYADHPNKSDLRQESYSIKVVVPFVD